jgi:hypothetical protein
MRRGVERTEEEIERLDEENRNNDEWCVEHMQQLC